MDQGAATVRGIGRQMLTDEKKVVRQMLTDESHNEVIVVTTKESWSVIVDSEVRKQNINAKLMTSAGFSGPHVLSWLGAAKSA